MVENAAEKKWLIVLTLGILITIGGNVFVFYTLEKNKEEIGNKLQQLQTETEAKTQLMRNTIAQIQEEQQKKIEAIATALEKVESESKTKFTELEKEVKNVNIKSGDFSAILQDIFPGVVNIVTDQGRGSGTIITEDGYIVTNYHVIQNANIIQVADYNKKIHRAYLIGAHQQYDIAVLKVNGTTFRELRLADSSKIKVGERVIAVGNPAGLGFSVTEGIVSQLERMISPKSPPMIQTDVPINPGNSGGPLINIEGKVIGVNRLKIAGFESLGFAIPSNVVKQVAEEITKQDL